jgi:hypothetical protein
MKLRHASALRRLEYMARRVDQQRDRPDKLLPILKDVCETRLELYDDPSFHFPVLEARLKIATLIEAAKECEVAVGRALDSDVEDARYHRLDAEVCLVRAKAGLSRVGRNR